jgi:tRNA(fMet)-specific endonuclease VapC
VRGLLIDTNAYSAFKAGDPDIGEVLRLADTIYLCPIVLGELLAGFVSGGREARNREELADFLASTRVRVLPLDGACADSYALVYLQLRRRGRPIPTNDLWLAAVALRHGLDLLTRDAHFLDVDGLRVVRGPSDYLF